MNAERQNTCPCCEGSQLDELGRLPDSLWFAGTRLEEPLPGGRLYSCSNCRLKFRSPVLSDAEYSDLYNNATTATWSEVTARMDWDLVARYVSTKLPERGRILDFGCYTGGLLARLDDRYERYGVEVNRAAADVASQNIGQPVWSSIDEIPSDLHFDVVIAADVIEHFSNPMSLVQQLAPRLSENGVLILTTGDADSYLWDRFGANWWYCFYPEHIAFISKDWLNYMCRVTDFSVAHYETFRYARLSSFRRLSDWAQTYFYGVLPSIYLGLARLLLKASTRGDVASVPGAGLTRDHLFIVLNKAAEN
jgi:2-polyprenyl-3-methyl-5-hydroxy-6-metoxy-1,4-benzoquinol methylase